MKSGTAVPDLVIHYEIAAEVTGLMEGREAVRKRKLLNEATVHVLFDSRNYESYLSALQEATGKARG